MMRHEYTCDEALAILLSSLQDEGFSEPEAKELLCLSMESAMLTGILCDNVCSMAAELRGEGEADS